jgi:membrane protease YdiL (CAAX protease family)
MQTESLPQPNAPQPVRPRTVEETFRVRDSFIIISVLLAAGGLMPLLVRGGVIPEELHLQVGLAAVAQVLVIILVLWLARRRGISVRNLVLGNQSRWAVEVLWGLGLALLLFAMLTVCWLLRVPVGDPLDRIIGQAPLSVRLEFFILAAILAPLGEELLFRGVLQASLVPRAGLMLACLLQAALFGLMHLRGWAVMLAVFIGGLAYGALALWRGSLLPGIVTHASFNGLAAGWLLALFWLNAHTPASTMAEAQQKPAWWDDPPLLTILREETPQEQFEAALWRFGSFGLQLRKDQIKAFDAVRERFPEDDPFGARSLLGIQEIYLRHLDDPRRAIITGQKVLTEYRDQKETQAEAVLRIAEAYFRLKQADKAREWIERAESEYGDVPEIQNRLTSLRESWESQAGAGR